MDKHDYFIDGLDNDEYHNHELGLSSSNIKDIIDDPALIMWREAANQDMSKLPAIDFGTNFHSYFLEPDRFKEQYQVLPMFNRYKKEEKQAELDLIAEWQKKGITSVKNEDMDKLKAMQESAMAHPTVNAIMSLSGVAERSYFWKDKDTGVICKCRPDWLVENLNKINRPIWVPDNCKTLVMDVKTIAQIDKMNSQVENLKYYVQDALYTRGIEQVTGTNVCFVFAFDAING